MKLKFYLHIINTLAHHHISDTFREYVEQGRFLIVEVHQDQPHRKRVVARILFSSPVFQYQHNRKIQAIFLRQEILIIFC